MDNLVQRLSDGDHQIEVGLRPNKTAIALRECLDRGWVYLKFPNTRGGTEIGIKLEKTASDLSAADWESAEGSIKIVGSLTLNYEKVRCVATVDLRTLTGLGHLEPITG